ncbi:uncharacterized protein NDAI_0A07450 [Naumovozyma dairenensis CBS 421]|uniref:RING-type domain-containing protein n=1 Tax=Naumovozyma dairenensis (strain ATCC 10597 / BCRC 20456 / CBS 421 / NBRC 0211 / NRRL Y-12639) TaxID=1071378 RepID=G0W511_NAUDC|nr:hypothetical protein NDAI_0A07450 [Naumovozyma dairenensis CBS 421]CCD22899.1 hypothetical protein NDAI_0A07450 [Naumovozyma dairenensis CBS 421]
MSTYEEEHGLNDSDETGNHRNTERRELRNEFRELFQAYGSNNSRNGNNDNVILLQMLSELIPEDLQQEWFEQIDSKNRKSCSKEFIDSLPRIKANSIKDKNAECAICFCKFLEDKYPLVAELPHCGHRFDLECISVWLSKSDTCPLCRDSVLSHKTDIDVSKTEMEEDWGMYG